MAARRTLPLLVALWASLGLAQTTFPVLDAGVSFNLDGGNFIARAYPVYLNPGTPFVMAGAGQMLQVFDTTGAVQQTLLGTYDAFAVVNGVDFGGVPGTLVVVASFEQGTCGGAKCLRVYRWDPSGGFQQLSNFTSAQAPTVSAMAMGPTTDAGMSVFYTGIGNGAQPVWRQDLVITADGGVTFLGLTSNTFQSTTVFGLAVFNQSVLFVSPDNSALFSYATDITTLNGGVYISQTNGNFADLRGLFLFQDATLQSLVGADPTDHSVLFIEPKAPIFEGGYTIHGAAFDGGSRTLAPAGASVTPDGTTLILIEEANPQVPELATFPVISLVTPFTFPDAGPDAGGGGQDSGSGGIPTIPSVPPGPGAVPPNSFGCSSAAGLPILVTLLAPLLLLRRRRRG